MSKITILVCYHKPSPIIANEFLQPILLGAQNAPLDVKDSIKQLCARENVRLWYDDGAHLDSRLSEVAGGGQPCSNKKHISSLNPYFCELTAIYWAWKNVESDYYGLFHYRRVLDFKTKGYFDMPCTHKYHSSKQRVSKGFYKKYGIDCALLDSVVGDYDMILPQKVIDHMQKQRAQSLSMYELYEKVHHIKDLELCCDYIKKTYPKMQDIALEVFNHKPMAWHIANMFIMKKDLFFEYCEWLFDILFAIKDSVDYKSYDSYQARVFGFLAERLFNVWITYKCFENPKLKIKEVPLVFLKYKSKRRWFGWVEEGNVRRFYVAKLRILKRYTNTEKETSK